MNLETDETRGSMTLPNQEHTDSFKLRQSPRCRLAVCLAVFATLVIWMIFWPYTGQGDASLHYTNLRETAAAPRLGLTAWARPLYVAIMLLPAQAGYHAVRLFTALLTTILVWQTMRMADDLELPNPTLAGLMLIWQPYAFALASDTMTEMPMALGVCLVVRLWWARRIVASSILVSFLPMLRPEGFLLIAIWAVMLLCSSAVGSSLKRRVAHCTLLGIGMLCWVAACLIVTGDPLYLRTTWPWPADSSSTYHSGPIWQYVKDWPEYCGPVLIVLFILGIVPAIKKKMAAPWAVWSTVFAAHTVLWWQGWFTSAGLQRVLLPTSPITALICLYGLNLIAGTRLLKTRPKLRRAAGVALVLLATAAAMFHYVAHDDNHHPKLIRRAVAEVRSRRLLDDAPALFMSDEIIAAALDLDLPDARWKRGLFNHEEQSAMLESLPIGTVGIWDNQRGKSWYHVEIDELPRLGYEIVFDADQTLPSFRVPGLWSRGWPVHQRCVVVVRR